jgi:hypothetical protein
MAVSKQDFKQLEEAIESEDLCLLREFAALNGGFWCKEYRRSAWSILLHCDKLQHFDDFTVLEPNLFAQIKLDVDRSFNQFKELSDTDKLETRKSLLKILNNLLSKYNWLNYYQGFHDICSIFILVQGEHLAQKSLSVIMNVYTRDFMEPKMTGTMLNVGLMMTLMKIVDRDLYNLCNRIDGFEPFFGVSWFLTWFSHHLDVEKSSRIFDVIIAYGPILLAYLSVVVFELEKSKVMKCSDVGDVLSVMCKLDFDNLNVEMIIEKAMFYHKKHRLNTSKLGRYSSVNTFNGFSKLKSGSDLDFELLKKYAIDISLSRENTISNQQLIYIGLIVFSVVMISINYSIFNDLI